MEDGNFGTGRLGLWEKLGAVIVVSLTLLFLSWIPQIIRAGRRGSYHLPPGPKGWPLIGAIPYVGGFPNRSFHELSKKYGPVMYMRLGAMPVLVISNAEIAKELFQMQDQEFASRPPLLVASFLSYGLQNISFAPYGPQWRQARKVASFQLLTHTKLTHSMGDLKNEVLNTVHIALAQSQSGSGDDVNVNMSALFNAMAMNVMTQMMWKKRHRNVNGRQSHFDQKFVSLVKEILEIGGSDNIADFLPPVLQSFAMRLSGLDGKVRNLHKQLDEFFENIIREREQASSKETTAAIDDSKDDFLEVMLKLMNQPDNPESLSRDSTKAILTDMMVAGTDTSSVVLEWMFSELMRNPDMRKKAQDELTTVVGEHRLVSEADLPRLKYLNAVVKETLRHHSPGPLILRLARTDSKVGGYDIPATTSVFFNVFAIHHDPAVWEDPFEFNPDRFLGSDVDYRGRNFELLPFGSGRRICPGVNLASTLIHMAAAQLLHMARWTLPEGQKPKDLDMSERFGIVVSRAKPLFLIAKPRLTNHVTYPTIA